MAIAFKRATRRANRVRIALLGPSGSGKTYTALRLARTLAGPTGRIAVIDTERGSASLYSDEPGIAGEFDALELDTFGPDRYTEAINAACAAGYDVVIVDSLSHAWSGKGGALELVDDAATRAKGNKFVGWRDVTPMHNDMIEAMLQATAHVIVTMRVKMEYVQEKDEKGRTVIRKVGLQPIQRDGMEYEFDVIADVDMDHHVSVGKTRCTVVDGKVYRPHHEHELAESLMVWLSGATPAPPRPAPAPTRAADDPDIAAQKLVAAFEALGVKRDDLLDFIEVIDESQIDAAKLSYCRNLYADVRAKKIQIPPAAAPAADPEPTPQPHPAPQPPVILPTPTPATPKAEAPAPPAADDIF